MSIKVCRYLPSSAISVWAAADQPLILLANSRSYARSERLAAGMDRLLASLLQVLDTPLENLLSFAHNTRPAGVTIHSRADLLAAGAGLTLSGFLPNFVPSGQLAGDMDRLRGAHRGRLPTPHRRMSWRG